MSCVTDKFIVCSSEVSTEGDSQLRDVQDDPWACGQEIFQLPLTSFMLFNNCLIIGVLLILKYVNIVVHVLHNKYVYVYYLFTDGDA